MNNSSGVSHHQSLNKMNLVELVSWCTVNGLVAILVILGNSLVIAAFACFKKLRTRTNYFVIGLAAADILVGLLSIPFWIATLVLIWLESVSWTSNSLLYRAFIALDVFSGIASILHLLLISLERLYAIGWPVKHRVSSRRCYMLSTSMAWYHARRSSDVCSRNECHPFSTISGVTALLFHSPGINLHHIHHDRDYREVSYAPRQFLEPSQGKETHYDNLLLNNSLHCCMDTIHSRKYHHVSLCEMFHTKQRRVLLQASTLQQLGS